MQFRCQVCAGFLTLLLSVRSFPLDPIRSTTSSNTPNRAFKTEDAPFLALITERCSCDSDELTNEAIQRLEQAVSSNAVDLVSVRVNRRLDDNEERTARFVQIVERLLALSDQYNSFTVVVSSDWMVEGLSVGAHGVHFKEDHRLMIPTARIIRPDMVVGTSTHSVESAQAALTFDPDYLFAGTCFETPSHPEKTIVEGPALPAQVARAVPCPVLAIGGLDATNCADQVRPVFEEDSSAHGIATIRAILHAEDPAAAARVIQTSMRLSMQQPQPETL